MSIQVNALRKTRQLPRFNICFAVKYAIAVNGSSGKSAQHNAATSPIGCGNNAMTAPNTNEYEQKYAPATELYTLHDLSDCIAADVLNPKIALRSAANIAQPTIHSIKASKDANTHANGCASGAARPCSAAAL